MKSFQSLFPPLSPNTLSLTSARRVVLVSYNADRGTIDFRHYIIKVKPYGVSKHVPRILESTTKGMASMLDLGNEKDVTDFLLRKTGEPGPYGGYENATSSTESVAGGDGDAVDLAEGVPGKEGAVNPSQCCTSGDQITVGIVRAKLHQNLSRNMATE